MDAESRLTASTVESTVPASSSAELVHDEVLYAAMPAGVVAYTRLPSGLTTRAVAPVVLPIQAEIRLVEVLSLAILPVALPMYTAPPEGLIASVVGVKLSAIWRFTVLVAVSMTATERPAASAT